MNSSRLRLLPTSIAAAASTRVKCTVWDGPVFATQLRPGSALQVGHSKLKGLIGSASGMGMSSDTLLRLETGSVAYKTRTVWIQTRPVSLMKGRTHKK